MMPGDYGEETLYKLNLVNTRYGIAVTPEKFWAFGRCPSADFFD